MIDLSLLKSEIEASTGVYSELRYQENIDIRLTLLNGQLVTNLQEASKGVSARAFSDGYWGFSSHISPTRDAAAKALKEAIRNATFLSTRKQKIASLASARSINFEKSYVSSRAPMAVSAWIDFLKDIDALITSKCKDLKSRSISLAALDMEKRFLTSEGSTIYTFVPRAHLRVSMTKDSKHGPVQAMDSLGGLGQLQDQIVPDPNTYTAWLDQIYKIVTEKSEGVLPDSGVHDVILASDLAGILAHEAVGHTPEADLVLGGSVAGDYLNLQVASPLVWG
ncbi:MAG: hypothetical protein JNM39_00140 [Bdellovibrionaceae bacterium]|nr:hypothetical protein [Pseudobdellovibrionaceae bacterium]